MSAPLNRIVLYARDIEATAAFYEGHFGFVAYRQQSDRIVELKHPAGGASLMLHQAGRAQKAGQSTVKLVFDIEDVPGFREDRAKHGLIFGPLHHADGYVFANGHDPAGNPISVSSRAYRRGQ